LTGLLIDSAFKTYFLRFGVRVFYRIRRAEGFYDSLIWVGNIPEIVQGWRPTSATNQPVSAAIQGSGIHHTAIRSNQRFWSATRVAQ
jgi:hypothetical protein